MIAVPVLDVCSPPHLGDAEVHFKSKSTGSSAGKSNTNLSEHNQTKKLLPPEEFLKLPTGKCVIINPGFTKKDESYIPIKEKIYISREYLKTRTQSEQVWETLLTELSNTSTPVVNQVEIQKRRLVCEELFPDSELNNSQVEGIESQSPTSSSSSTLNAISDNFSKFAKFV